MSDNENDEYPTSDSEDDTGGLTTRKKNAVAAKKNKIKSTAAISDNEDGSDSDAVSDADNLSAADSKDDSDIEDDINPDDIDEDALFADAAGRPADIDPGEFQFGFESGNDEEDDSDLDDDEDGTQYLQKLDKSVREQTIANHHPELIIHNYDEVEAMTTVVRDERGVVIDPLHRTLPFLSKYERTRILGERAKQINDGAKPFVETDPSVIDGYLIALKELEEKKLPFIIRRPLNNGASEYWKLKDLEFL
jgi:DNA-directed RNA polymerase I, II, and III subunit RPABC2